MSPSFPRAPLSMYGTQSAYCSQIRPTPLGQVCFIKPSTRVEDHRTAGWTHGFKCVMSCMSQPGTAGLPLGEAGDRDSALFPDRAESKLKPWSWNLDGRSRKGWIGPSRPLCPVLPSCHCASVGSQLGQEKNASASRHIPQNSDRGRRQKESPNRSKARRKASGKGCARSQGIRN